MYLPTSCKCCFAAAKSPVPTAFSACPILSSTATPGSAVSAFLVAAASFILSNCSRILSEPLLLPSTTAPMLPICTAPAAPENPAASTSGTLLCSIF